ncbi:MAG: metallophosphoesterase [Myxococcota bacterium]
MRRLFAFGVFFLTMAAITAASHHYFYRRLVLDLNWGSATAEWTGAIVFALLGATLPAGMILQRRVAREVARPFAFVSFVWMGLAFLLLSVLALSDLLRIAVGDAVAPQPWARGVAAVTLAVVAIGALVGLQRPRAAVPIKRVPLALAKWPSSMTGFRVVQLSDVHIGPTLGRPWLAGVVEQVNELAPDVVVITGDLVDGSVAQLAPHVAPLADLKSRFGTYFVTGNHEYYSGADAWLAHLASLGVTALRNAAVRLGGDDDFVYLAGVDDWTAFGEGHGPDLAGALADTSAERPVILLAHQPRQFIEAAERGVDLQLSGHTHGGQIVPWNLFVRLQQPYVAGLARRGNSLLYTSRGTGYWGPPLRVGAPAEITLLELRPA